MEKLFITLSMGLLCFQLQAQTILLQEDFSTASGTTPPLGWTVQTAVGDPLIDVWRFDNPGRRTPNTPIAGNFACFDSDKLSNNSQAEEVYLISPSFNATTTDNIILEFDQYFISGFGSACTVEVYTGTTWLNVYSNSATTTNPQHSTIDITSHIQNKTNAHVRFKWTGNYSWYWIIENVKVATQPFITEQFTEQNNIILAGAYDGDIVWGDYDNDGDLDIILSANSGTISKIYQNNNDNNFTEQTGIVLSGVNNSSLDWGDYNNDSYLDILITGLNSSNQRISKIFQNNGNNTFSEQTGIALAGVNSGSATWGDYNNDGYLDILLTGSSASNAISKIFRNNGDNSFAEQTNIVLTGLYNSSAAWGDYDNDGDLDILLAGNNSPGYGLSKVYRNNGNNSFTEQSSILLTGVYNCETSWGDYDSDGNLDILLSGYAGTSSVPVSKIYRNNGDNSFTEQSRIELLGVAEGKSVWGDYNNDGNLDVLLTGTNNIYPPVSISKIYKNNGNNTFTEQSSIILPGVNLSSTAFGDYNDDGTLDIILAGFGIGGSKIYRNNQFKKNTQPTTPSSITALLIDKKLNLSWDKATDIETPQLGLTYNLRIGTTPGGCEILSPMALPNGKRLIADFGNAWHNTRWTIDLSRFSPLPEHIYYSVQAVDNGFMGSEWSPEKSEISDFVADFLPYSACQKTEIQLQDKSYSIQYPISTYQWKFTEGSTITTSSLQSPKHTFQTAGTYQIELTITNSNNETTSRTKSITILPSPLADFTAPNVCQGVPVWFDNTTNSNTTAIIKWQWSFGDNTPDLTVEEPGNHGYLNYGDYNVKLIATATNGCSDTIRKMVSVVAYPVAAISANAPLTFCSGNSVTLSVGSNPNYLYKWMLNGTAITNALSNNYIANQTGNYSVEVVNTVMNCSKTSDPVTVTIQDSPAPPTITTVGPSTFCQGDSVIFTVTNNPGYTYLWKLNGGAVGMNSNQYAAKNQGTYSLEVTNSNGCKATSANVVSTAINPLPNVSAISLSGSPEFCEGDSLTMGVASTAGYSYQWRNDYGLIIGGTTNKYAAKATGRYFLDVFNEKGCKISSQPVNVNLRPNPQTPVIITENFHPELCNIENPIVLRIKDPVETYSYQWKRNGYPFNSTNQSYLEGYLPQGDYTVVVNNSGCKNESVVKSVYFENAPKKPLLYAEGPNVWYLACSNDTASQYKWYYNGAEIPGADKYLYVANQSHGNYYVSISNSIGCFTASDEIKIPTSATGIDDTDPFDGLKIYPNPTTGLLTIEMDNQVFGELDIKIFSQEGKNILNIKAEKTTEHFSGQFDLSGQPEGIYIINLIIDKYLANRKVIVE